MKQRLDRLNPDAMQAILRAAPGGIFKDRTRLQCGIWFLGRLGLDHGIRHWSFGGTPAADAIRDEIAAGIAQGRIGREVRRQPGQPLMETFRAIRVPTTEPLPGLGASHLRQAVHLLHATPVPEVTLAAVVDWFRAHERRRDWRGHALNRVPHHLQEPLERAAGLLRALGIDPDLPEIVGSRPEIHEP